MFCTKCGSEIEDNAMFCTKCGNEIENKDVSIVNERASITFAREKQFYGVIVPIKVYLDGIEVASVSAGKEEKVPVSIGKHRIAFNLWSGNGQYDVEVSREHPNIKVNFKLSMGIVTSKPKITSIENI